MSRIHRLLGRFATDCNRRPGASAVEHPSPTADDVNIE